MQKSLIKLNQVIIIFCRVQPLRTTAIFLFSFCCFYNSRQQHVVNAYSSNQTQKQKLKYTQNKNKTKTNEANERWMKARDANWRSGHAQAKQAAATCTNCPIPTWRRSPSYNKPTHQPHVPHNVSLPRLAPARAVQREEAYGRPKWHRSANGRREREGKKKGQKKGWRGGQRRKIRSQTGAYSSTERASERDQTILWG